MAFLTRRLFDGGSSIVAYCKTRVSQHNHIAEKGASVPRCINRTIVCKRCVAILPFYSVLELLSPVAGKRGLIVQREQPVSVSSDLPWSVRGLVW